MTSLERFNNEKEVFDQFDVKLEQIQKILISFEAIKGNISKSPLDQRDKDIFYQIMINAYKKREQIKADLKIYAKKYARDRRRELKAREKETFRT